MILYFGCWSKDKIGHYMYDPSGETHRFRGPRHGVSDHYEQNIPWGYNVDGGLAPHGANFGVAAFHQLHSFAGSPEEKWWSALSWWDSSADRRPGSSSTFIIDEKASPAELLEVARLKFPTIFTRFTFQIVLPEYESDFDKGFNTGAETASSQ